MDAVLDVVGLAKRYGDRRVLEGIDMRIESGQVVALIGPNGAGKTTFVSMVAGLLRPDAGRVTVCGVDALAEPRRAAALTGIAPQETGLYPTLTIEENLVYFARLHGLRGRELRKHVEWLAESLGLESVWKRPAMGLSGGERRRAHTAIAMIGRRPLLLLDEPTTGADVETRARLLSLVRSLADDGAAVCYTTHYLPEVEELDASIVMIDGGRVIASGPANELVRANGRGRLELTFSGPAPKLRRLAGGAVAVTDGSTLVIETDDPGRTASTVLGRLGDAASRLESVEVVQPSLDSVFRSLTGRRIDAEQSAEPVATT